MKKIVLISCVSKKLDHKAPATELYISPLFIMNFKYARRLNPDRIFILSAEYGLLDPQQVIEPYNTTLNTMSVSVIRDWSSRVLADLRRCTDLQHDHFVILAGTKYRKYLLPYLSSYELPLEGLTIGRQLQFLKEAIRQ